MHAAKQALLAVVALLSVGYIGYAVSAPIPQIQSSVQVCDPNSPTNCWGRSNYKNITTSTDTEVLAAPGTLTGIVVNTGGTTSTAAIYDDADGTCSSNLIGTFDTTAIAALTFNIAIANGICVTTAGGAAADITVLYQR